MNELLFLGTGAADWKKALPNGFFRRNSAALLNGELMLDCGPHIFDYAESFDSAMLYGGVTDILITHKHGDHFSKASVYKLAEDRKIRVGCDKRVGEEIGACENVEIIMLRPFEEKRFGAYTVIPLLANHDIVADGESYAYNYIVKTPDGKTLFYGLDGAWFLRPSWNAMLEYKFDVSVLDCTVGDRDDWRMFEHNTIPMLRSLVREMRSRGIVADDGAVIASHLARTLHGSHEETEKILSEIDVLTAFDGMKISF